MVMEMQSGSLLRADQAIVKVVAGLVLGAVRRRRESHCREAWYVSTPGARGFRSLSVLNLLGACARRDLVHHRSPSISKPVRRMLFNPSCKQLVYDAMHKSRGKE
jgi:hypothetical protein